MTPKRIALLVLVLLILGIGALFWTVNAATRVDLLFRIPFVGAWHLIDGITLPLLLLITALVGAIPAAVAAGVPALTAGRSRRNLRRQVTALKEELEELKRSGRAATSAAPKRTSSPAPSKPAPSKPASKPTPPAKSPAASAAIDDFDDLI